jgi:excisionase family DNA binding protein
VEVSLFQTDLFFCHQIKVGKLENMKEKKKGNRKPDGVLLAARQDAIANGRVAAWGIRELAVCHGVSPGHVRNAIARKELRASKLGRRVLITNADAQAWMDRNVIVPGKGNGQS